MPSQPRLKDRINYAIDNTFSRGTGALIAWLGILSLVVITVFAALVTLLGVAQEGEEPLSFAEAFWRSLMRTMDAGTMGGDTGWGFRLVMFGVTLGGVFVISTLIGVLTSAVEAKVEALRKGRSRVIENGHTVILGWSEQVFTIVSELIVANENQRRPCIVILGEHDKVAMEEELAAKAGPFKNTRIVCRSGSPIEASDLSIVALNTARSIIALSPETEDPDAEVIKTVLAIVNHPDRRHEPYHIVAELRDPKNAEVARVVGKSEVEWIQVGDLIARIIAQTCRQSGLSVVYTELLDFGGDEIYFTTPTELVGQTFGAALAHYEQNAVIGLCAAGQQACLNPTMDTVLQPGDRLVLIAADDDQIVYDPHPPAAQEALLVPPTSPLLNPEKTLILGWNWRGSALIRELDGYVAGGSDVLVVADAAGVAETIQECCPDLQHQKLAYQRGDTTARRTLEALPLASYDHIIILSYSDALAAQQADARTLVTLLHLRDIADRAGVNFPIVSEMLDVRNRNLAEVTRADDFIVSDKIVSLMMAQVAENKALNAVFADMFDPEGSEIYLKPASAYVKLGQPVGFYTVLEAARRRGEVAFGYRLRQHTHDPARAYGVRVNPPKREGVTFGELDRIIVAAAS
jgi:voltage-gated potassium channel Kch